MLQRERIEIALISLVTFLSALGFEVEIEQMLECPIRIASDST